MKKLTWNIPLRTVSELNCSQHWTVKAKRHRLQKKIVKIAMSKDIKEVVLPCKITLIRLAERELDSHDNLPSSFKYICDQICELLIPGLATGRADDDKRIEMAYKQEKAKRTTLRVEIEYGE
jgi:hypothetical protein